MAQHDSTDPKENNGVTRRDGESRPEGSQADDTIFAEPADEHGHGVDHAAERGHSEGEAGEAPHAEHFDPFAAPETPAAPPSRAASAKAAPAAKKRGAGRLSLSLAILGLLAVAGGVGAVKFKDRDPRLKAVADVIEDAARDPASTAQSLISQAREALGVGEAPRAGKTVRPAPPAQSAPPVHAEAPPLLAPPVKVEPPAPAASVQTEKPAPVEVAPLQEAAKDKEPAAPPPSLAPPIETPRMETAQPTEAAPPAAPGGDSRIDAMQQRLDQLEAQMGKARSAEKPAADQRDNLAALEGRIDELSDEVKALRNQLNAPKAETRVEPQPADVAPAKAGGGKSAAATGDAATVVVAQSLLREIERGKPYASEQAALTTLGADPAALAALAPFADTGAPSVAQLKDSFVPIAKKLRALETSKPGGDLTGQLLAGASKLVKVRPSGQPAVETLPETVAAIETALAHDNLAMAEEAFARLPDTAQTAAKSFGDALRGRRAAEKAAETLLANAIAALGQSKN